MSGRTLGLTAFAALALAGCGGRGGPSIVLYNGQHPQLTDALVAAFEKQTGIAVQMRTNDSVVLADQILQEGGSSPADVYISENSPELMSLQQHGRLARLSPAVLDQVPAAEASPAGDWVGMALRVSSLVYDPALLTASRLPKSVLDLARPGWKGEIAIAPTDSDFPPVVGAVAATYGTKTAAAWLAGLKRNAQTYQDEEAVVAAVNRGDVAAGIVNQYYWYRLRLEVGKSAVHSTLYYFPSHDPGSITNISGAAVLASSTDRANAERFVAFLVGKAGQRIIARSDDFEYPARPDVAPSSALPPLDALAHDTLSAVALGDDQQAARLIVQAGLI
jgi:iron(III) transport system substrate-binding protein